MDRERRRGQFPGRFPSVNEEKETNLGGKERSDVLHSHVFHTPFDDRLVGHLSMGLDTVLHSDGLKVGEGDTASSTVGFGDGLEDLDGFLVSTLRSEPFLQEEG